MQECFEFAIFSVDCDSLSQKWENNYVKASGKANGHADETVLLKRSLDKTGWNFKAYRRLHVPSGFNIQEFNMVITLPSCVLYGSQNKPNIFLIQH